MPEITLNEEITPEEAEAAQLYAFEGCSFAEVWRRVSNSRRAKPETAWREGARLFARPQVGTRVRDLLIAYCSAACRQRAYHRRNHEEPGAETEAA